MVKLKTIKIVEETSLNWDDQNSCLTIEQAVFGPAIWKTEIGDGKNTSMEEA